MALTNSQHNAILREYTEIQNVNRTLAEKRKEEVLSAISEFVQLEASVSTLSASAARSMLSGNENAAKELHAELAKIRSKKKALLVSAGYPEDYLDPIYDCSLCKDTGYVDADNGLKTKCSCFRKREFGVLYSQSNIRELIARENFSTLSYEYYQGEDKQRFEAAVRICRDFTKNFDQDYSNLLFYGTVGTGKSFLSGCIAKELLDSSHSVIYFSASALFDYLAKYTFDRSEKEAMSDLNDDLYSCDLLIIDDLGTELTNSFVASQLFSCLNQRALRKKSTIISTNLSLEEIRDRYSDRIFSRISSGFRLCKLTGPDIRIYKKRMQNK